jgi:hypothetical protein
MMFSITPATNISSDSLADSASVTDAIIMTPIKKIIAQVYRAD